MSEVPIGTALAYAGEVLDTGKAVIIKEDWLLCNGAPLSHKGKYEALFTAIGTAHGNASNDVDPSTTFNLPDYRGLFLRGVTSTTRRDPNAGDRDRPWNNAGGNVGNRVGSIQLGATKKPSNNFIIDVEKAHTHGDPTWNGQAGPYEVAINRGPGGVDFGAQSAQTNAGDGHTHEIKSGGDDETRPINAYVNYIIRAK